MADPEGGVAATITSSTTVGIAIPAGKTLKATIAYKAPRCPMGTSPAAFDFGPALAHLFADQNCFEPSSDTPTTVRPTTLVWCDVETAHPCLSSSKQQHLFSLVMHRCWSPRASRAKARSSHRRSSAP